MGIVIPSPITLALAGVIFWPVTLGIAAGMLLLGLILPWRWAQIACFIIAGILTADCLLAFWLTGDEARVLEARSWHIPGMTRSA